MRAIIRIEYDESALPGEGKEQVSRAFTALVLNKIREALQPNGDFIVIVGVEDNADEAAGLLAESWVAEE